MAIMGPSGVGKTTLLNIIGLLDSPTAGECYVQGQATSFLSERQKADLRNKTYGFIFQTDRLIPHYTVKDNILLPLKYRKISFLESKNEVNACLAYFELVELAERYPRALSGGERQRVAWARAMVHRPKVLLADELTSSLDEETKNRVLDRLFALQAEYALSMIIVTHDRTVAQRCDKVMYLKD